MPEETIVVPPTEQPTPETPATPDMNNQLANAMWNGIMPETPAAPTAEVPPTPETPTPPSAPQDDIIAPDEWVKTYYGWENAEAGKKELEELRQLKATAQTPAEIKFANDEAKKYFEAIQAGKTDDVYNILHQQRQLAKLESLPIANATEAAEILKASLQYKHKDLTPEEVAFLHNKRYTIPSKPAQGIEQSDEDYAAQLEGWKQQVQEKETELIIEAKLAKPELVKYKSELVLPDIPKINQQLQPQEDLAVKQQFVDDVKRQLYSDNSFTGYSIKVKDKEVELPIDFKVSQEEMTAFNKVVEAAMFNTNAYLDNRWFNPETKTFNMQKVKADLYVLENLDKILHAVGSEAAAKRYEHHLKIQNNVKLNGVNTPTPTIVPTDAKAEQQQLAEFVWKF